MTLVQSNFEYLTVDVHEDGVAVVTLDRPDRLNAVNAAMHTELTRLPIAAAEDPRVKVLVLTGAGRAFCVGGDFSGTADWTSMDHHQLQEGRRLVDNFLTLEKPILAAVNGHALGLGASLALLADVVVVGPSTAMADPHVKFGIAPGDGGALLWPMLMGPSRAKWYLMTGEQIRGRDLVDSGLATFFAEDDKLLATAVDKASQLAAGAQQAIIGAKSAVNQFLRQASTLVMPLALSYEVSTMASADHAEAQRAFVEKRSPRFGSRPEEQ